MPQNRSRKRGQLASGVNGPLMTSPRRNVDARASIVATTRGKRNVRRGLVVADRPGVTGKFGLLVQAEARSCYAQQRIDHPAAADVRAGVAAVIQDVRAG